jgi:toluene monooxygenase system protein E
MAPASTITNCATYTTADHLRWVSHTAYRTRELANTFPACGFGTEERRRWELAPCWQGFRELLEKALVTWDWAESFTVFFLVAKPAIEATLLGELGNLARSHGDMLLGLLTQAQMRDAERHRRWVAALVHMAAADPANRELLARWCQSWVPRAEAAVTTYCAQFPTAGTQAAAHANAAAREFRTMLGL